MNIHSFLHEDTETYTHVVVDAVSGECAVVDPVLDFDPKSGHVGYESADRVIEFIQSQRLKLMYLIETHAHADHLSAAPYLKQRLGGKIVIGKAIEKVQAIFKKVFNFETLQTDASQFDLLTEEGSTLPLGTLNITALHVPGHAPADMAYAVSGNSKTAIFVGDTLFAPDVGTARCDFPGGSSAELYDSIQRLLAFSDDTVLYLCHDYPPEKGRARTPTATVADQKQRNIHVKHGITKNEFVRMRDERDKTLAMPRLILPSVQVNINAGKFPAPESNGVHYLKIPLNVL